MTEAGQWPRRLLVVGGTSEIGLEVVRALSLPPEAEVVLAGRSPERLSAAAQTLGCRASIEVFDALDRSSHGRLFSRVFDGGPVDVVLVAFGILGDQQRAEADPEHALQILDVDFRAQVSVLLRAAAALQRQGAGTIVVFSSIAGVRGRRTNFVYGSAKAGLDAFACGLGDRLAGTGVRVLVVRPGFVVGRMTAGMSPAFMATTPAVVGSAVARAVRSGRTSVWVPPPLAVVAWAMRLTPRPLWRRVRR